MKRLFKTPASSPTEATLVKIRVNAELLRKILEISRGLSKTPTISELHSAARQTWKVNESKIAAIHEFLHTAVPDPFKGIVGFLTLLSRFSRTRRERSELLQNFLDNFLSWLHRLLPKLALCAETIDDAVIDDICSPVDSIMQDLIDICVLDDDVSPRAVEAAIHRKEVAAQVQAWYQRLEVVRADMEADMGLQELRIAVSNNMMLQTSNVRRKLEGFWYNWSDITSDGRAAPNKLSRCDADDQSYLVRYCLQWADVKNGDIPKGQHILCILGMAGAGKSAISATLKHYAAKNNIAHVFYSFHAAQPDSMHYNKLCSSLALQAAEQSKKALTTLDDITGTNSHINVGSNALTTPRNLLLPVLTEASQELSCVWIIIDGLDLEGSLDSQDDITIFQKTLLESLQDLAGNSDLDSRLKIFITCRTPMASGAPSLPVPFDKAQDTEIVKTILIRPETEENIKETRSFLDKLFSRLRAEKLIPAIDEDNTLKALVDCAGGNWQWIVTAATYIEACARQSRATDTRWFTNVRKLVEGISKENGILKLNELYSKIIKQSYPNPKSKAWKKAKKWLSLLLALREHMSLHQLLQLTRREEEQENRTDEAELHEVVTHLVALLCPGKCSILDTEDALQLPIGPHATCVAFLKTTEHDYTVESSMGHLILMSAATRTLDGLTALTTIHRSRSPDASASVASDGTDYQLENKVYACRHWADHLLLYCDGESSRRIPVAKNATTPSSLLLPTYDMIRRKLLVWIEHITFLTGGPYEIVFILKTALELSLLPLDLERLLVDAVRACQLFTESLHTGGSLALYSALLAHCPRGSPIHQLAAQSDVRLVRLLRGQMTEWPSARHELIPDREPVLAIAWSSNNGLAVATRRSVTIFNSQSGERLSQLLLDDKPSLSGCQPTQLEFGMRSGDVLHILLTGTKVVSWQHKPNTLHPIVRKASPKLAGTICQLLCFCDHRLGQHIYDGKRYCIAILNTATCELTYWPADNEDAYQVINYNVDRPVLSSIAITGSQSEYEIAFGFDTGSITVCKTLLTPSSSKKLICPGAQKVKHLQFSTDGSRLAAYTTKPASMVQIFDLQEPAGSSLIWQGNCEAQIYRNSWIFHRDSLFYLRSIEGTERYQAVCGQLVQFAEREHRWTYSEKTMNLKLGENSNVAIVRADKSGQAIATVMFDESQKANATSVAIFEAPQAIATVSPVLDMAIALTPSLPRQSFRANLCPAAEFILNHIDAITGLSLDNNHELVQLKLKEGSAVSFSLESGEPDDIDAIFGYPDGRFPLISTEGNCRFGILAPESDGWLSSSVVRSIEMGALEAEQKILWLPSDSRKGCYIFSLADGLICGPIPTPASGKLLVVQCDRLIRAFEGDEVCSVPNLATSEQDHV